MPDKMLLLGVASSAAAAAAIVLLAFAWPWRAPRPTPVALGWVLGVTAAFYLGSYLLELEARGPLLEVSGRLLVILLPATVPPVEVKDRLLVIVLPATVLVECLAAFRRIRWWLAWPLRLVIAAGAARVLLHGSVFLVDQPFPDEQTWSPDRARLTLVVLGLMLAAVWISSALLTQQKAGWSVPLALALACGGAGVSVMFSDYQDGGQLGFPLAGALAGAAVASLLVRAPVEGAYLVTVGTVGLFSLLIMGHYFGGLTAVNALLLLSAPVLGWLPELPYARRLGPRLRGCLRVLLVAIPVAVAVVAAQQQFELNAQKTSSPTDEIDYDKEYK